MQDAFLITIYNSKNVAFGSPQHYLPIIAAIALFLSLINYSKRCLNEKKQWLLLHCLAMGLSLFVIYYHLNKVITQDYNIAEDLPLYLCSLLGILIPLFTYFRKYWMFEVLVFWIIGGTLQAVITPDLKEHFPSLEFFRYWTVHLGLLGIIFYVIMVFGWKPRFKSVFKSFLALQVYVLAMMAVNFMLSSNYFYLNAKPESATLLDYFGEWPYYIIVTQLIGIPYFLLIYLPFYLRKKETTVLFRK